MSWKLIDMYGGGGNEKTRMGRDARNKEIIRGRGPGNAKTAIGE
jgi:hypothetical protein